MGSDRKENFKRLAEARTNKILKAITLLGNLSNKSYYEYDKSQIDTIFDAIQAELDEQRTRFDSKEDKVKRFRL